MFLLYHTDICVHKHTHKTYTDTHRRILFPALAFISHRDLCLFWLAFRAESAGFRSGEEECVHTKHALTHACMHTFLHHLHISRNIHPHLAKTDPFFLFSCDTGADWNISEWNAGTDAHFHTPGRNVLLLYGVGLELLVTQHLHTDKTTAIR